MKQQMYNLIQKIFLQYVDGINKDGVFATIDGQQYNIKIVAKKSPVLFEGMELPEVPSKAPSLDIQNVTEEQKQEIENIFAELIDYV